MGRRPQGPSVRHRGSHNTRTATSASVVAATTGAALSNKHERMLPNLSACRFLSLTMSLIVVVVIIVLSSRVQDTNRSFGSESSTTRTEMIASARDGGRPSNSSIYSVSTRNFSALEDSLPKQSDGTATAAKVPSHSPASTQSSRQNVTLHLLGERHSGTNWITKVLEDCFQSDSVRITPTFSRWKHWFQDERLGIFDENTGGHENAKHVVVALFRNVNEWVPAMHRYPHHAPLHLGLDWRTFVTRPWTMPRYGRDIMLEAAKTSANNSPASINGENCQWQFRYKEIVPCLIAGPMDMVNITGPGKRVDAVHPVYEHDHDGIPFPSVLGLRAAKIRNFVQVAQHDTVDYWEIVRYEDLLANGTSAFLRRLEHQVALPINENCQIHPPAGRKKRRSDPMLIKYLEEHVDWIAEAMVGYHRDT